MRFPGRSRRSLTALGLAVVFAVGCTVNSAKSRYILAEKLWTDGKYQAAVREFEKVIARDPKGKLGLQALYRAAMTQTLYLNEYQDAIRNFKSYIERTTDRQSAWEARKQIGEILFSKIEQHEQAIQYYGQMLQTDPQSPDAPELLFRIGRSQFFLSRFDEAATTFKSVLSRFPQSPVAEKAELNIGITYFTRGEQRPSGGQRSSPETYQDAMDVFQKFIQRHPDSQLVAEAKFGIANCLEEMDQLDAAYHQYEAIQDTYPSPNVIRIKLARIRERQAQKSR